MIKPLFQYLTSKIFIVIMGAMLPMMVFSQNDFESWSSIDMRYKVSKNFSLDMSSELRLNNNSQDFNKYLVDVGGEYEFAKYFDFSMYYRYSRFDDEQAYVNEHKLFGKLAFSYPVGRFELGIQTRYERSYEVYGYSTLVKTEDAWRNKVSASYNIYGLPLEPYASFEHFFSENKSSFEATKYRLFGGLKYKISRDYSSSLYYGIQRSYLKTDNSYIIGLKLSIRLN